MSGSVPDLRGGLCLLLIFMMIVQGAPLPACGPAAPEEAALPRAFDDWPQFMHDAMRSGTVAHHAPADNTTIWSFQTGGDVNASPVVADGVVYIPSSDGCLYALNCSTGGLLWRAGAGGPYYTPVCPMG